MQKEFETLHREIMQEIAGTLGFTQNVPGQINETQASLVLGVKSGTLCNWRCTGRYGLAFIKSGRLVRYRVADLAEWIAKRRIGMEG